MRWMFWTAFWVFLIDQLSKYLVVHLLNLNVLNSIRVWPPYLNFVMAWNRGVNFGIGASGSDYMRWFLIAIAVAISGWVVLWMWRSNQRKLAQFAAGLLIGGAMGNVVDRFLYGAVADFLNVSCCGIENPYVFNIADIAIFAGAFGLILFAREKKTT